MTIRNVLFALGALFAGNAVAAGSFSIYFNGESQTSNCHVDGVSNAQFSTSGNGNLVASAATPLVFSSACGISGSGQQLTFGPAQPLQGPGAALAAGSNVTGNFSVLPLNAQSCTVAITTTSGTGTATGPSNGYVCGLGTTPSCSSSTPIPFSAGFTNTATNASAYQATVTCQGVAGASPATLTSQVMVNQSGNSGGIPTANFTCTQTASLTIGCTDQSSDSGGTIGSWSWNFGDSTTSILQNPSHTYASAGTYTVSLTVADSVNPSNTDTKTKSVSVTTGGATACTTGSTGDVSGYSAICSGYMTLHTSANTKLGPSAYTFPFVFGSNWPGSYWGYTEIFNIAGTQFLSIPFTPSPAHTIGISENQTYTGFAITFSISTAPGLFNNGKAGNGVLCAQTNNPTLQFGSAGSATNCPNLDPNTQYWFNVIPAKYSTTQGKWVQGCSGSSCQLGIYAAKLN